MTHPVAERTARIESLDVLRGFALCGILFVNAGSVTGFGSDAPPAPYTLTDPSGWLQLFVQQRFFPIFSLLFGVGFSLLLRSATRRTRHPRVVLARRLSVLLVLGVVHHLVYPGEALAIYGAVGLLVLLPSTLLPRIAVAICAFGAVAASLALADGGVTLVPGMFLLGSALVRYGVVDQLEDSGRVAVLFTASFVLSVVTVLWQLQDVSASGFSTSSAVAGLSLASAYVSGLLLLMRSRHVRQALVAIFAPLGRTALTCYVGATALLHLEARAFDLPARNSWTFLFVMCALLLATQWCWARWWLSRYQQGPLEWLWRAATWGHFDPLRQTPETPSREPGGTDCRSPEAPTPSYCGATRAETSSSTPSTSSGSSGSLRPATTGTPSSGE